MITRSITMVVCLVVVMLTVVSPGNAQWVPTNGPYGASVHAFASIGKSFFVATSDGVFESVDTGLNWVTRKHGLSDSYVHALGSKGATLFAATDTEVYISTNEGL